MIFALGFYIANSKRLAVQTKTRQKLAQEPENSTFPQ